MKKITGSIVGSFAIVVIGVGNLMAGEVACLKAELADLKAKVAAMENAHMAPVAGGDAESLTCMKRNGAIKVGGNFMVDLLAVDRDDRGNGTTAAVLAGDEDDDVQSTIFIAGLPYGSVLKFEIAASKNMSLNLTLELDDAWNETTNQDDLLDDVYFLWTSVGGKNIDLLFGKKRFVDYGLDKFVGITPSLHDGWAYWLSGLEQVGNANNPHDAIGTNSLPTAAYRTFQIEAIYHYKNLANFYFTLFQNNETTGGGRTTRGMHEDRSDDTMLFQSFAIKAEIMPAENLSLQASFINFHNDSLGDRDINGGYAEEDKYAFSISADYSLKAMPLDIWIEYQHGFDWTYDDRIDTDTIGLGLIWTPRPSLSFSLLGEWAGIGNGTWSATGTSYLMEYEKYWQTVVSATYSFDNGIYVTLEYAHQWYDGELDYDLTADNNIGRIDLDRDADVVGLRMGWEF